MLKIPKSIMVFTLLFFYTTTYGHQERHRDSLPLFKDTVNVKIPSGSSFYLKQSKGDVLRFQEANTGFDAPTIIAILAVVISALAIYFPISFNAKSDRKSTFFKIYEYWNTDYMQKSRRRFWEILKENRTSNSKVSLKKLRDQKTEDYHIYETVYDLLNDLARLYNDNHLDKRLVKILMIAFIRSYGNALEEHFDYYESDRSFLVKMSAQYYQPIILLKNELCKGEKETYASFEEKNITEKVNTESELK